MIFGIIKDSIGKEIKMFKKEDLMPWFIFLGCLAIGTTIGCSISLNVLFFHELKEVRKQLEMYVNGKKLPFHMLYYPMQITLDGKNYELPYLAAPNKRFIYQIGGKHGIEIIENHIIINTKNLQLKKSEPTVSGNLKVF